MPSWVGDRIVFGLHDASAEIASVKPDGGELRILGTGHDPVLSPDGKRIAFTGEAYGGVTVFVMDGDGSRAGRSSRKRTTGGAVFLDWSPGRQEPGLRLQGTKLGLELLHGRGFDGETSPRQLTHLGGVSTPARWSP